MRTIESVQWKIVALAVAVIAALVVLAIAKVISPNVATTAIVGIVAALCPSLAIRTTSEAPATPLPPPAPTENTKP